MKKLFIIGGMGAGKSTARKALVDQGLPYIDLDLVGHQVLSWDTVREELKETFGSDIFDEEGTVDRRKLAARAFASPAETRKLNRITLPRIEELFSDCADVVIAVIAPLDMRIQRAVASGFSEEDVRNRIARQITDADRIEAADVVFNNNGTPDELQNQIVAWWQEYEKSIH